MVNNLRPTPTMPALYNRLKNDIVCAVNNGTVTFVSYWIITNKINVFCDKIIP